MKNVSGKFISALAVLSLAAGCGKDSDKSSGGSGARRAAEFQEDAPVDGSNIQGHYQAKFTTLNPHVNGTIPGSANFFRKEEKIFAYVRLFAGGVKAWHMQHVYEGSRCPTMRDDKNGDGFIDIAEAEAVLGKVLIPMDSDISTQSSGRRFFPLGDLSGYYHYERIANFKRFLADLMDADPDPADNVTKLPPGQGLRLVGRTFMVQGVAETIELPETVATKERRRPFQTLPVACGVFQKVNSIPGQEYVADQIPGPVAAVDPNQDRPADETIPEPTTGGSAGGGTGTNDSDSGNGPTSDGGGSTTTPPGPRTEPDRDNDTNTERERERDDDSTSTDANSRGRRGPNRGSTGGSTSGGSTSTDTTPSEPTTTTGGSTDTGTTTGSGTTTTTTTSSSTSSSSSSSSSSSTGGTTGGSLDSSSGI